MPNHAKWERLGDCTTPLGAKGDWVIRINKKDKVDDIFDFMSRARSPETYVPHGEYKVLAHKGRKTVVMSNTPFEVRTNEEAYRDAKGHVLINGLGMGMLLEALLHKPEVVSITVVEIDRHLIDLVAPYFNEKVVHLKRPFSLNVFHEDAFRFNPPVKFDYVWHDIWDGITPANLPEMAEINRKYGKFAHKQGTWSRAYLRKDLKSNNITMDNVRRYYDLEIKELAARRNK